MRELKSVLFILVSYACLAHVSATRCYSCNNIGTSEDCTNMTDCGGNEVCFARADGMSTGKVQYTVGCSRGMSAIREDSTFCTDVCTENLCNLNKCNIPVSPNGNQDRPPRCFSCDLTDSPSTCTNLVQCSQNEICYIREVTVYGHKRFRLGCMNKQHCSTGTSVTANPITVIGKRFINSANYSDSACSLCCERDHCNAIACQKNQHSSGPSHQINLFPDNNTCVDKDVAACVAFGSLDSNACVLLPKVDQICPKTCGICGHFGWSQWSKWSDCSRTCDEGSASRTRSCIHQINVAHAQSCPGDSTESKKCNEGGCVFEGSWSDWEAWGTCSRTCQNGTRSRLRYCTGTDQIPGGLYCSGEHLDVSFCSQQACPVKPSCPDNWLAYHSSCYFLELTPLTFSHAQTFCRRKNSTLVHIESAGENKFIVDHLNTFRNNGKGWWLGMTDSRVEGSWMWTNINTHVNFTYWKSGQPDDAGFTGAEDCAVFLELFSYKWNDCGCTESYYVICEI